MTIHFFWQKSVSEIHDYNYNIKIFNYQFCIVSYTGPVVMKFAIFLLAVLPFVLSASVNERFIESLLGGYDSTQSCYNDFYSLLNVLYQSAVRKKVLALIYIQPFAYFYSKAKLPMSMLSNSLNMQNISCST